ncbi:hypothetical protein Tco_0473007 [Tanacetum coccineum]
MFFWRVNKHGVQGYIGGFDLDILALMILSRGVWGREAEKPVDILTGSGREGVGDELGNTELRQTVISELLAADYRRQRQLTEALKLVKSLQTQMAELQDARDLIRVLQQPGATDGGCRTPTLGLFDIAYAMIWTELKKKITDKYCPKYQRLKSKSNGRELKVKESDQIEKIRRWVFSRHDPRQVVVYGSFQD